MIEKAITILKLFSFNIHEKKTHHIGYIHQRVQHSFIFWVALPLPLTAKRLSGTPAPTPPLKIEWNSFSTPFKGVRTLFSTPISKFLERKLPKGKKIWLDWTKEIPLLLL